MGHALSTVFLLEQMDESHECHAALEGRMGE